MWTESREKNGNEYDVVTHSVSPDQKFKGKLGETRTDFFYNSNALQRNLEVRQSCNGDESWAFHT